MNLVLSLVSLIVGAGIATGTSILLSYLQHGQRISDSIVDKYMVARDELCDCLGALASLNSTASLDAAGISDYRKQLIALSYKYYDFFPAEVLRAILCLFACLSDRRHRLFTMHGEAVLPMTEDEITAFITRIGFIENFRYSGILALHSKDRTIRELAAVNFQAFGVLSAVNSHLTITELRDWTRHTRKQEHFIPPVEEVT